MQNDALTVVEVAMEIAFPPDLLEKVRSRFGFRPAREVAMSTSVGGIGPLLRERIVSQAASGIRVIGVTLLYETTWIQSWFDWGQLHLEKRSVLPYLHETLEDTGIVLTLPMYDGKDVRVRVWKQAYGKADVYFLDCPAITHVVYPSEEDAPPREPHPSKWGDELRYKQSWLVGRGTLALMKHLQVSPNIVVLSETPTLFGYHRIATDAFQKDPLFASTRYIFNDHTPMEYAHPVWSADVLAKLKIDATGYDRPSYAKNKSEVDITRLLIGGVEGVFGVSQKHGRVMRAMPSLKDYASKIDAITNGVLPEYWQAPEFLQSSALSDADLLALKERKKADLLDWIWRHYGLWHTWKDQVQGKSIVLWTRRITGYKRIDMLIPIFRDPGLKKQFLDANIVLLLGGRIHQHDDQAQSMVYTLLDLLSQDKLLQERVIFLDNFNVWMAPRLFQGADAAIMLADDGREASATGFMKAQLNGDLIIATDDGAIPESVHFLGKEPSGQAANGFEVPYVNGHPTPEGLIHAFKALATVIQNPTEHAAMLRSAVAASKFVQIDRTVQETLSFYNKVLSVPLSSLTTTA